MNECASYVTAQHLVRNKPSRGVIEATRQSIRNLQHPDGKTLIERNGEVVDLRNNASDARCKNNKLMRPYGIVIAIDDDSADGIKMKEWNGKSTISKDFDDEDEDKLKKEIHSKIDRMKKRAGE